MSAPIEIELRGLPTGGRMRTLQAVFKALAFLHPGRHVRAMASGDGQVDLVIDALSESRERRDA